MVKRKALEQVEELKKSAYMKACIEKYIPLNRTDIPETPSVSRDRSLLEERHL
jgi:hypothetical protein